MITKEEAQNLLVFLSRVQLTGNEAIALVMLQEKLARIAQPVEKTDGSEVEKKKK